jgi:hypothetical protein
MTGSAWLMCWPGEGYAETSLQDEADLVILNTCHIREKAVDKVYSELGRVREIKTARAKAGLGTRIVVAGCVAQAEGAEIQRRQTAVDLVVGPQSYHRLPDLLARAKPPGGRHGVSCRGQVFGVAGPGPGAHYGARRHRFPDGAGGLRQVLRVLRRALHARRRGLAAGGAHWPKRESWPRPASAN